MFLDIIETSIKDRLTSKLGENFEVEILPELQAQFTRPFVKPRVTVAYTESDYDKPKSTFEIAQQENLKFELLIQARKLRGEGGIYDLFYKVRRAIIGFEPTHCGKIYGIKFEFADFQENLFTYKFVVACRLELVEDQQDETVEIGLNTVTIENTDNNYENIVTPNPS